MPKGVDGVNVLGLDCYVLTSFVLAMPEKKLKLRIAVRARCCTTFDVISTISTNLINLTDFRFKISFFLFIMLLNVGFQA